jgi:serine/threonine-protein phosphatase 2A regulatory subunit A
MIDELKSDDKKKRINSIQSLGTVAISLGKERTRNELLPYILDLMDDEEEILIELASALDGNFLEYIGGPLFAPHLFKPLEKLSEVEETVVRERAVTSLKNILTMVNVKDMRQQII